MPENTVLGGRQETPRKCPVRLVERRGLCFERVKTTGINNLVFMTSFHSDSFLNLFYCDKFQIYTKAEIRKQ